MSWSCIQYKKCVLDHANEFSSFRSFHRKYCPWATNLWNILYQHNIRSSQPVPNIELPILHHDIWAYFIQTILNFIWNTLFCVKLSNNLAELEICAVRLKNDSFPIPSELGKLCPNCTLTNWPCLTFNNNMIF